MQRVLEHARTENPPLGLPSTSLIQIARRLGFTAEGVLSKAIPEMYASYKQWRRDWFEEQRTNRRERTVAEEFEDVAVKCTGP